MKTTTLILSAIIAALPFAANATQTIVQTQTPAAVGSDGTVNMAATSGPYQTATIGEHDDEHIATTAYVKGAYNDAIAGINSAVDQTKELYELVEERQVKLVNRQDNDEILSDVVSVSDISGLGGQAAFIHGDEYNAMYYEVSSNLGRDPDYMLMSAGAVIKMINDAGTSLVGSIPDTIHDVLEEDARVTIYTTWGNDTSAATTNVSLTMLPY